MCFSYDTILLDKVSCPYSWWTERDLTTKCGNKRRAILQLEAHCLVVIVHIAHVWQPSWLFLFCKYMATVIYAWSCMKHASVNFGTQIIHACMVHACHMHGKRAWAALKHTCFKRRHYWLYYWTNGNCLWRRKEQQCAELRYPATRLVAVL